MTIKGYANYGVLAHEKHIIFTATNPHGQAQHSERVEIELPEGFDCGYNAMQEVMITASNGRDYLFNEILQSWNDKPVLVWYEGNKKHTTECDYKVV